MVRTQIQLREDQSQALREIAAARGVSMAELVRQSVDMFIRSQVEPTREEKRRRALEIIGITKSGLTDLGTDHDDYL